MPIDHQVRKEDIELTHSKMCDKRDRMKEEINDAIDQLLDEEILHFKEKSNPAGGFPFGSYLRGIYYLTLAKYLNPTAYTMAWSVVRKLEQEEHQE